jgi:RHS repeat-associated protein
MAVMKTKGGTSTTTFPHLDHLGSTEVVTDTSGNVVQTLDYYPYGKVRVDQSSSGANERKRFTGYEYDPTADLNYAKARYYGQTEGRFLSQDPVFVNMGVDKRTEKALHDPQLLNSYSYPTNNPLLYVDRQGELRIQFSGNVVIGSVVLTGGVELDHKGHVGFFGGFGAGFGLQWRCTRATACHRCRVGSGTRWNACSTNVFPTRRKPLCLLRRAGGAWPRRHFVNGGERLHNRCTNLWLKDHPE